MVSFKQPQKKKVTSKGFWVVCCSCNFVQSISGCNTALVRRRTLPNQCGGATSNWRIKLSLLLSCNCVINQRLKISKKELPETVSPRKKEGAYTSFLDKHRTCCLPLVNLTSVELEIWNSWFPQNELFACLLYHSCEKQLHW